MCMSGRGSITSHGMSGLSSRVLAGLGFAGELGMGDRAIARHALRRRLALPYLPVRF